MSINIKNFLHRKIYIVDYRPDSLLFWYMDGTLNFAIAIRSVFFSNQFFIAFLIDWNVGCYVNRRNG